MAPFGPFGAGQCIQNLLVARTGRRETKKQPLFACKAIGAVGVAAHRYNGCTNAVAHADDLHDWCLLMCLIGGRSRCTGTNVSLLGHRTTSVRHHPARWMRARLALPGHPLRRCLPSGRQAGSWSVLFTIWRPNGQNVIYTFGARMGQTLLTHLAPEWAKCYLHIWRPNGPNVIYTFGARMGQMIFTHLAPEWAKCYLHVWRPNGPNAIYTFGTRMPVT